MGGYLIDLQQYIQQYDKIIILSKKKNIFLAEAYNEALKWANNNGFSHIMTMDQDSVFLDESFKNYVNYCSILIENEKYVNASFSPIVKDSIIENFETFILKLEIKEIKKAISSGSIYNVKSLIKVGGFREDYKIDYVDFEICSRLILNNYTLYQCQNVILSQQFGNTKRTLNFYNLNYSPMRLYFQTRNRIIYKKEYPNLSSVGDPFKINLKLIIKILISQKNKYLKIKYILKGLYDGLNYKTSNKEIINGI